VGQITTRGQAVTGSESTITNRIPYLAVDLTAQIFPPDEIDLKFHCTAV
jgi:hypothetical protein